jgi:mono/diheme cytochrome c family protein
MKQFAFAIAITAALAAGLVVGASEGQAPSAAPQPAARPAAPTAVAARRAAAPAATPSHAAGLSAASQTELVTQYCATCHSERGKAGGLSLAGFNAMKAHEQPEVIEKIIRKLRAGMMPPAGSKRPDAATIEALTAALEARTNWRRSTRTRAGGPSSVSTAPSTRRR